jgi:DNA-binding FadR family transcriptional regulator
MARPITADLTGTRTHEMPGSAMTDAIRVPKTAEIVADQIRRRIIRGDLSEGDCLPPENQLMGSLSISRPTLREAFRVLEAEGLISIVRGSRSGARVHRPRVDNVSRYAGFVLQSQGTTIRDIYDARLAIEPYIAGQLAERCDERDIEQLRSIIAHLVELVESRRYIEFTIGLAGFHKTLVELGGNRTLLFLYNLLEGVVERHQVQMLSRRPVNAKDALRGVRSFQRLVDLIAAADQAGAQAHWHAHVVAANKDWIEAKNVDQVIDLFD